MTDLRNAHVQSLYRPISIAFVVGVVLIISGVVYTAWTSSRITLTPKLSTVMTPMSITFGNGSDGSILATTTSNEQKATVTVTPSGTGTPIPAHATGDMTIINTTGKAQPLASGTRLQSKDGIIVRTTARVDVPAQGKVTIRVIADPLGETGNVAAGRFTIVALWPGLQQSIYGETTEALTGGMAVSGASLSLEELTKASDEAEQQVRTAAGASRPGYVVVLDPVAVTSSPKADVPSASYAVTVTVRVTTISYDPTLVRDAIRNELQKMLNPDAEITSIDDPKFVFDTAVDSEHVTADIQASGKAQLRTTAAVFSPASYASASVSSIRERLAANPNIKASSVQLSPWWRTSTPEQADRITIIRLPAQD